MVKEIVIKPSYVFKNYFKANLIMMFLNRPVVWILMSVMLLVSVVGMFQEESSLNSGLLFLIFFPAVMAFAIYRHTKKLLNDNPKIHEDARHFITEDYFQEKGESFDVKYFWKDSKKIVEYSNMFLIYIMKGRALVISKDDLTGNQYNELKALFRSIPIKQKLK